LENIFLEFTFFRIYFPNISMKEFPTCEPSSIASSSSILSVPNRGERADADDEVVMPNKEELVFDVEEEPNQIWNCQEKKLDSQSKQKELMQVN